jgi:hypothetical protein
MSSQKEGLQQSDLDYETNEQKNVELFLKLQGRFAGSIIFQLEARVVDIFDRRNV